VRERNPSVPVELERIIAKLLEKDRALRYQSAAELRAQHLREELRLVSSRIWPDLSFSPARLAHLRIVTPVLVVFFVLSAIALRHFRKGGTPEGPDSIVVLPFANTANDPEVSYLADGLPESITDSLSRIQNLRVIARTTAAGYKGTDVDVGKVGRELKVRVAVVGRVSRIGDTIRVQADLIDTAAGTEIWG